MKKHLFPILLLLSLCSHAQTNVRAWYAQGQVWVVWQASQPFPETFGIYKKATAFTNTSQATLIGRPFHYEYFPGAFISQTGDSTFTYRIPKPDGSTYQLLQGEGLFVETVTQTGAAYYAVVPWGQTAVTAGVNITASAVNYTYNPNTQPVNCHLQKAQVLSTGHKSFWFSMWSLGRQDENAGRPDFPVTANAAKNGMPSMFIVSQALVIDTANGKKVPMTHWLHGGGMTAEQFLANDFYCFNIEPQQGISVSHNDDLPMNTITETGDSSFTSGRTLWFGWTKNHNPFDPGFRAGQNDTVINYTQRRIMWINDWLIRHLPVDPNRVSVQGYSMGSGGAVVLAKTYPEKLATATLFNCGFRSGVDITSTAIVGSMADNLATNLKGYNQETIHIGKLFSLNTQLSSERDMPLIRIWVGKNDVNDRMHWGPDMVAQLRVADSLGWGTQINWDERPHTYQNLAMHWIQGFAAEEQTYRDNLAYQERFRSNQSYPGFFNHRLEPLNNDPGSGTIGINNGDGDNWGTWGGWHNWDLETLVDEPGKWEVTAWLTAEAPFSNDICPENALLTGFTIRKPQQFKPAPGKMLEWRVRDLANNQVIQAGQTVVESDGLVKVPQIYVTKASFRTIRIQVYDPAVATLEPVSDGFQLYPNPASERIYLPENAGKVQVFNAAGVLVMERAAQPETALDIRALTSGFYWIIAEAGRYRFVKI